MTDRQFALLVLLVALLTNVFAAQASPADVQLQSLNSQSAVQAESLAVIVNGSDPLSIKVAQYYQSKRGIPRENIIYINFEPGKVKMSPGEFATLKRTVESKLPENIQAYLLTWTAPYRVGCMSISSAFAFGYSVKYCAKGCKTTHPSPYFNSDSRQPHTDYAMRPTMLLAAENFADAKALIDRGLVSDGSQSDGSQPKGTAYLVATSDKNRTVRQVYFSSVKRQLGDVIAVEVVAADAIENKTDVMFYFTGKKWVEGLSSNHYLPGAVADHLTSTGGALLGVRQMSAMQWLKAGATGSYGTVVEPCNFTDKFPNPLVMMEHYLAGEKLIEAYWKSVKMPGQGVFIGDPLASPYGG